MSLNIYKVLVFLIVLCTVRIVNKKLEQNLKKFSVVWINSWNSEL